MFCPKCGNELKDSAKFCTRCGTKIERNKAAAVGVNTEQNGKQTKTVLALQSEPVKNASTGTTPSKMSPKRKNKLFLVLLSIVALLIASGGGATYYMIQKKVSSKQEELSREKGSTKKDTSRKTESKKEVKKAELETEMETEMETAAASEEIQENPVTSNVMYSGQADYSGLTRMNIAKENVTQSSYVMQNEKIDNTGWSAFDGDVSTSWQEGKADDGVGEYVVAVFDRPYQVKIITFLLGNHRSDSWFIKNNRPKKLLVNLDGKFFEAEFPDEKTEFALVLSEPVSASNITVTIEDVYVGTEYRDTVVAEVGVYGN